MEIQLTPEEKRAIAALRRLAKTWPKSLWLFSASGRLNVMKCGPDGKRAYTAGDGGTDPDYVVTEIHIPNDGGDW